MKEYGVNSEDQVAKDMVLSSIQWADSFLIIWKAPQILKGSLNPIL